MRRYTSYAGIATIFSLSTFSYIFAGHTAQQLQQLHQQIGKDLISMRRETPTIQPRIYALLDQVGTMYRLANQTVTKKKRAKQLFKEEQKAHYVVKKENHDLLIQVRSLKTDVANKEQRLAAQSTQLKELVTEYEALKKQVADLEGQRAVADIQAADHQKKTGTHNDKLVESVSKKRKQVTLQKSGGLLYA